MKQTAIIISSGNEQHSGGLFVLENNKIDRIDFLPTAGLHLRGDRFYRTLSQNKDRGAEILAYDQRGIESYRRLDPVHAPHDVSTLADGTVIMVSPPENGIFKLMPDGSVQLLWRADAPFDAWHLNCVAQCDGRLYATAFGRFGTPRGWSKGCTETGILFDVETGHDIVTGLTQPHTPRWLDGAWTICDSGSGQIVRKTPDGAVERIATGGFPRGLCVDDERVYVGVSERRHSKDQVVSAFILILDRRSWSEIDRIPMEAGTVYDMVVVDRPMLESLRTGFVFPCRRTQALDQLSLFQAVGVAPQRLWAVGERLNHAGCRISIEAFVPSTAKRGQVVGIPCTVTNRGNSILVSVPPHPVLICYRWTDADGNLLAEPAIRTALPLALPPANSVALEVLVETPPVVGRYELVITGLQEFVTWFDAVSPDNAFRALIDVLD